MSSRFRSLYRKVAQAITQPPDDTGLLKKRPLLTSHLVTYFSFSNEEKAYLSDVLLRTTFLEITQREHAALEFADGRRTVREIISLLYNEYPRQYPNVRSAERELLTFFKNLYDNGLILLS